MIRATKTNPFWLFSFWNWQVWGEYASGGPQRCRCGWGIHWDTEPPPHLEPVYDSTHPSQLCRWMWEAAPFTPDPLSQISWLQYFFFPLTHKMSQKLSAKFLVPLFGFKINHVCKCNTAFVGSSDKGAWKEKTTSFITKNRCLPQCSQTNAMKFPAPISVIHVKSKHGIVYSEFY